MSPRTSASLIALVLCVGCNNSPAALTVVIEPDAPTTSDQLVAVATSPEDADVSYTYAWFRDDAAVPDVAGSAIAADRTARGETWRVEVVATSGGKAGDPVSASVKIVNALPSATAVITPQDATSGEDLLVTATGDDPDDDPVDFSYSWTRNGQASGVVTNTVPGNLTSVGDTWTATVIPRDASGAGVPATASVELTNAPPLLRGITFDPSPVTRANDAHAVADVVDTDTLSYTWSWKIGGQDAANNTDTLPRTQFERGDVLEASVTVSDGVSTVGPIHQTVTVVNAVPFVDGVQLSPTLAYETSSVLCTPLDPNDADGDAFTLAYSWTVNGATIGVTEPTLTGSAFNRGNVVQCSVTARDAVVSGVYRSSPLTILNSPPVIQSAALSDYSPQTGDTLSLTLDGPTDADGDAITLAYEWYVNGTLAGTAATLPPTAFSVGQSVYAIVTPSDAMDTGESVQTSTIAIQNGRPVISAVTFVPARATTETDLVAQVVAADPESDAISYTYAWKVGSNNIPGSGSSTLASNRFTRGDTVTLTVTASDTGGPGTPFVQTVVIQNALPTVASVVVVPTPFHERSIINCIGSGWFDSDGDSPPAYEISWYVNNVPQGSHGTLSGSAYNRGDTVRCALMPFDGREFGMVVDSPNYIAANTPPSISTVTLSDTTPLTGDTLTASVNGLADLDAGDTALLTYTLEWWVNDTIKSTTNTLASGNFTRGDLIYAAAVPSDGIDLGAQVLSTIVTVGNTAPVLTSASIGPAVVRTTDTITATRAGTDVDNDTLTYSHAWKVNDVTVLTTPTPTLASNYFKKGDKVKAVVMASDGLANSNAITTNVLTIVNTVPTAPAVKVTPTWARPGVDNLRCTVTAPAVDADNDIVTYRMTWTRNGVPHTAGSGYIGPTQTTWVGDTIPAADLAAGQTWVCTAVAWDSAAGGSATATGYAAALDLVAVDAGSQFTCGLTPSNQIRCWGYNESLQAQPLAGSFASIAIGPDGGCALTAAGELGCWGSIAAPPTGTWAQVGIGDLHGCALSTNGTIACWGVSLAGNLAAPTGTWSSIAVGSYHACALNSVGTAQCWGFGESGQTTPPPGQKFVELTAGGAFTCGRHADGTLACWGDPDVASPPAGTYTSVVAGSVHACALDASRQAHCWGAPTVDLVAPAGSYAYVAPGSNHTCGILTTGPVVCWGNNSRQQLLSSTQVLSDISPGQDHTCGVDGTGRVLCWGVDALGGTSPPVITNGVAAVSGLHHGCALRDDGSITCWGDNTLGQLNAPTGTGYSDMDAGQDYTCALSSVGEVVCWGDNAGGQGNAPPGPWIKVTAAIDHTCALNAAHGVSCWGVDYGGDTVVPAGTWNDVTVGSQHTCGVHTDGSLQCWGIGTFGQTSSPPGTSFVQVSAGLDHTCARQTSGALSCWGNNLSGRATPLTGTFTDVRAGVFHNCGTLSSGRVTCWGRYGL